MRTLSPRVSRSSIGLALCAILVVAPIAVGCTGAKSAPADAGRAGAPKLVSALVDRVVDGDTAVMYLSNGSRVRVRFIGVDAPEWTSQREAFGAQSAAYAKRRLTGRRVFLQIGVEKRDRYGRLLAYVWLDKPRNTSEAELRDKQFNAQLLLEGYAQLLTVPPNTDYVEQYRVFQTEAREANRGLWAQP